MCGSIGTGKERAMRYRMRAGVTICEGHGVYVLDVGGEHWLSIGDKAFHGLFEPIPSAPGETVEVKRGPLTVVLERAEDAAREHTPRAWASWRKRRMASQVAIAVMMSATFAGAYACHLWHPIAGMIAFASVGGLWGNLLTRGWQIAMKQIKERKDRCGG